MGWETAAIGALGSVAGGLLGSGSGSETTRFEPARWGSYTNPITKQKHHKPEKDLFYEWYGQYMGTEYYREEIDSLYEKLAKLEKQGASDDKIDKIKGMNVTIVTSAKTDPEGYFLLKHMGMPFRA